MTASPPLCVFVTGPTGNGRLRWLDDSIRRIQTGHPGRRCALLLAETGVAGAKRFAGRAPELEVHCLALPCLCCPALADLPGAARRLAEASGAGWLFIEVPALPAAGLIAEFDHRLGWPREVVVWLNRGWARDRAAHALSVFQLNLIGLADRVIEEPVTTTEPDDSPGVTELSLLPPSPE